MSHGEEGAERQRAGREDLKLIRAARGGNQLARRRLIARLGCIPAMLRSRRKRHGLRLVDQELDDLTQDIVLAVWRNLDGFDGRGELEGWVYGFVRRLSFKAIDARSRRLRHASLEAGLEPSAPTVDPPDDDSLLLEVERVLDSMDELSASIIRRRHHGGKSFEEIAGALDLPINTAKTRYYRGLRYLRERLDRHRQEATT